MRRAIAVGMAWVCLSGCEDKVGATKGEVDTSLAEHAADPSAHHEKTISASELSEGTLAVERLPAEFTTALNDIAGHEQRLSSAEVDLSAHATQIATNSADIDANEIAVATKVSKGGDVMTGNLMLP